MNFSHMRKLGCALCLTLSACTDDANDESGTSSLDTTTSTDSTSESSSETSSETTMGTSGSSSTTTGSTTASTDTSSETRDDEGDGADDSSQCKSNEVWCDEECIDPDTDVRFCGASGTCSGSNNGDACEDDESCREGKCVVDCAPGEVRCDDECIDPMTDTEFCGAKGTCEEDDDEGEECRGSEVCFRGQCLDHCGAGYIKCDGACIDPLTDAQFCGAKDDCSGRDNEGESCEDDEYCVEGVCEDDCARGLIDCNGECIDPGSDVRYCGARRDCEDDDAGEHCDADEVCIDGDCENECEDDLLACSGICVDPETNPWYCGADRDCDDDDIGEVCEPGSVCLAGECQRVRQWSEPTAVDDERDDASGLIVAGEPEGVMVAIWVQDDDILASVFDPDDDTWSDAETIDTDSDEASNPQIGVDGDGNALAVWVQDDEIRARFYDAAGGRWQGSSAETLNEDSSDKHSAPSLSVSVDGDALVAWIADSDESEVRARRWDGSDFDDDVLIVDEEADTEKSQVSVGINADGEGIVGWRREVSETNLLYAARFELDRNDNVVWGDIARIEASGTYESKELRIHTDDDGNGLALWVRDQTVDRIRWARIDASKDTDWDDAEFISRADGLAETPQLRFAANRSGQAVAVWVRHDDSDEPTEIYAATYDDEDWSSAESVQGQLGDGESIDPAVAIDEEGNALTLFVFDGEDADDAMLVSNAYVHEDEAWSETTTVVVSEGDGVSWPSAHVDSDGNAVGIWLQEDSSVDVYSSLYNFDD